MVSWSYQKKERMLDMKKVVWIDDTGDRWENLGEWRRLHVCPGRVCLSCPLGKMNNGMDVLCDELVREYPERVVELMQGELCRVEVEEKNLFRNVRTGKEISFSREHFIMGELCWGLQCSECPIKKEVEDDIYAGCMEWIMDHWEEGLKLLEWKKVENPEQGNGEKEVKVEAPEYDYFLMRHLGVGFRERFQVEGTDGVYHVGLGGRLFRVYDEEESGKREIEGGQVLYTLLEHPEKVRKIRLTEEHREYLEAVMKVFPEVRWVKLDGGWLLFGDDKLVLLSRENRDWEELKDGEERDVRELLGKQEVNGTF